MTVHIVATGGTFEKTYSPIGEQFVLTQQSIVPALLEECCVQGMSFDQCDQLVDSSEMKTHHRAALRNCIATSGHNRIVVVHGTSTIVETARFLVGIHSEKTIVLLGALYPVRYRSSEGSFNLGLAIGAAQLLPPGVYVAMQGLIIDAEHAHKDVSTGRFSSTGLPEG